MRALALVLLSIATTAGAAENIATVKGLSFQHGDWLLACDNTRTCRAAGYQPEDGEDAPVSVLLTRAGGPGQAVKAELTLGDYDEPKPAPATMRLHINGQDLGRLETGRDAGAATLTPPQVAALLKSLTRDSQILIVGNDGRQWQLSDQGASAVLLKMDEFQGRLGTTGALVRKGQRSEDTVPAAIPMPRIRHVVPSANRAGDEKLATVPALRAALIASLGQDECDALTSDESQEPLTVRRLGPDKLLVSTRCWMGAYNEGIGYWVANQKPPYQPELVTTDASDESDGVISGAQKGRGLGDCWSSETWTWDGRHFVKTYDGTTGLCRLVTPGGPWQMPTLVTDDHP